MKKILFVVAMVVAMSFASCGQKASTEYGSSADSTAVDTTLVDSVAVDSAAVDSVSL